MLRVNLETQQAGPTMTINGKKIAIGGKLLRIAQLDPRFQQEWFEDVENPEILIDALQKSKQLPDIVTFWQRLPDTEPTFRYPMEWHPIAALPIKSYSFWWEKQIDRKARNKIRKAQKKGVIVKPVTFDDRFVRGMASIFNETPIRQGRHYLHYGKDFETAKRENGTFLERSQFIAAYCGDELIGFIKMVYVGRLVSIMQILSKASHHERRPTNAMIAKAVELAVSRDASHLLYCKYVYHRNYSDALTEFKRRNGFQEDKFPRYFVPLTLQGRIAVALRLQLGLAEILPRRVLATLLAARAKFNSASQGNILLQRV